MKSASLHILLADDDDEDQEMFKEAIIAEVPDARVTTCWNGREAISYLDGLAPEGLPALIMLDYKMPLLGGMETLERLRAQERYDAIPVAVWSTSNQQEYIDKSLHNGAVKFFTKPNNPRGLKEMAASLLSLVRPVQ